MRSFIRFFFYRCFHAPKIGDRLVHESHINDPWNDFFYTVIDQKRNWYRLRMPGGAECSIRARNLMAFYVNINETD